MTSTTLEPASVPADRLAHGYRWEDEQWKEEPQLPDGAFGAMGGMLTSVSRPLRATSARSSPRGRRATAPKTGPIRRASLREMQQIWRARPATRDAHADGRAAAQRRRLRLRPRHLPDLRLRPHRRAQRRAAGVRIADAVAAGVRRRHHRVRQPHLHGVGRRRARRRSTLLAKTGGLQPRVPQPSPALVEARDAVSRLVDEVGRRAGRPRSRR